MLVALVQPVLLALHALVARAVSDVRQLTRGRPSGGLLRLKAPPLVRPPNRRRRARERDRHSTEQDAAHLSPAPRQGARTSLLRGGGGGKPLPGLRAGLGGERPGAQPASTAGSLHCAAAACPQRWAGLPQPARAHAGSEAL